jgi:RimJ/RimL family protein N-acetyltransferase
MTPGQRISPQQASAQQASERQAVGHWAGQPRATTDGLPESAPESSEAPPGGRVTRPRRSVAPADLLDGVARWGSMPTAAGGFRLRPVRLPVDLALVADWMNDPAVATFWNLDGPPEVTAQHIRGQLPGDGRSVPCLGLLDGQPMSYWEIYRADLDPLARHYPARPHDTGIHLLLGPRESRGRGLGSILLHAVTDRILQARPTCSRVVAEPDIHNASCVAAFSNAGFRKTVEIDLPDKRAALMIRHRLASGPS